MTDLDYSYTFKAVGNSVKIILTANNTEIYITDLIRNNLYSGYTIISPSEFAGYYLVNGRYIRVFTLNKDTTEVSKLHVDESIDIGSEANGIRALFIAVEGGLDIVLKEGS